MTESDPPVRRGRPRASEETKRRQTITFRVREDLRAAVEEVAEANRRTLSEQVEYYVDAALCTEAKFMYEYSPKAISPTMLRCLDSWNASDKNANVEFSSSHQYTVIVPNKQHIQASNETSIVPWVREPGGHHHAIEMAKSLIDGMVRGALESFEMTLGHDVVAELQADFHIGGSQINVKLNRTYQDLEMRCRAAESTIEHLQFQIDRYRKMIAGPGSIDGDFERTPRGPVLNSTASESAISKSAADVKPAAVHKDPIIQSIWVEYERSSNRPVPDGARRTLSSAAMARRRIKSGDLAELPPSHDAMGDYFAQLRRDHSHDFSTAALRRVIGRLGEDVLQLVPKFAPGWPQQFADLPADTRSALIGHLQHDAASIYQTLMSPKSPRGEALTAFRRMRNALPPRELADDDADEGPDEDFGDVEEPRAKARR
ncbi:hypothetical protein MKK63_24760 [Methylobacterium sp. J-088]|uniref:hypothetical protein n=1 Tax=Methylobacterium sp. J-088 TaxID=2836664 RepID=UPI001FBB4EA0|nr:hypothetical protein [Methylobacterium sp. J-088]MCJ2065893.1 hypothetical protein [Methylobacterium sp. J-088]